MKEYRKTATVKAKIFEKGDEDGMIHSDGMLGAMEDAKYGCKPDLVPYISTLKNNYMKPISELKKHNMTRILLVNKHGYFEFGYYKDGMIQIEGEWYQPELFTGWMSIQDLKNVTSVS